MSFTHKDLLKSYVPFVTSTGASIGAAIITLGLAN